ncbi:MAG: transcription antitermination factor NusB [Candidatus Gracilibacteria bacterium]
MASERHILRSIVVQTMFAWEFHGGDVNEILNYNLVNGGGAIKDKTFAVNLLERILTHREEILQNIQKYAPEWPLEKIAEIDRAILELAVAELLFDKDMPALVAINEGIELAKDFGSENSSKFINGVLSSLYDDCKN